MSDTGKIVALVKALAPVADQETVDSSVETYLDNHPEATTTVQDGSITEAKLASALAQKVNQVSSLSDEIDDIGSDVTDLKSAINHITDKMQAVEIPASANSWNKNSAQVGFLHKNGTVYTGGNYDNYVYGSIGEVSEGDVINFYEDYNGSGTIYQNNVQFVVCYDSNGTAMNDAGISAVNTFTVPEGVARISITIVIGCNTHWMALKNNSSAPTQYIPYYEASSHYIATQDFIHDAFVEEAEEITDKVDLIYEAGSSDQGKYLKAKTVEDGAVTEWEYDVPTGDYVTKDLMQKCEIKNTPKSANLWDDAHKNPGWYHQNGTIYPYANMYYCNIGSVSEGDVISYYFAGKGYIDEDNMYAVVCLDENGTIVTSACTAGVKTFTVPAGVSSITITLNGPRTTAMVVKNIPKPAEFIPYYEAYDAYIATKDFIRDALYGDIILNIPSKIYAVVGIELNIYFENITDAWDKYHWDVTCEKGKQMQRCYTVTPVAGDVGEYSIKIRASVDDKTYKEVSSTLVIASADSASGVSIIVLGDSTTANGMAVTKIHTDFENASATVQTLGTCGTSPNNHEGRNGWKASDYLTVQSRDNVDNPFYNPTSQTFDASYYFTNSGVSVPDWFFINLGINDMFGYASDAKQDTWIDAIIGYYDTMVESLQSADSNMKIGVCITIPPNNSQDAFGKAYGCGQTRDRAKRNNARWCRKLIEHFAGKEEDGIYLVPIHVNLDTVYNMGMESLPVNARNTSVTYQSPIANGGVHPVESGYWQIADVYTAFLNGNAD